MANAETGGTAVIKISPSPQTQPPVRLRLSLIHSSSPTWCRPAIYLPADWHRRPRGWTYPPPHRKTRSLPAVSSMYCPLLPASLHTERPKGPDTRSRVSHRSSPIWCEESSLLSTWSALIVARDSSPPHLWWHWQTTHLLSPSRTPSRPSPICKVA